MHLLMGFLSPQTQRYSFMRLFPRKLLFSHDRQLSQRNETCRCVRFLKTPIIGLVLVVRARIIPAVFCPPAILQRKIKKSFCFLLLPFSRSAEEPWQDSTRRQLILRVYQI